MKTMSGLFIASSLFCLGWVVSCTTTPPVSDQYQQDTAELPDFDSVGLEDGSTKYSWETYKGTIPFAQEVRKSTAVSGGRDGLAVFAKPSKRTARVVAERKPKAR